MSGRFSFYRHRRVLPFAAVWCLVFINGATLAPLAVPPEMLDGVAATPSQAGSGTAANAPQRLRYERGSGADRAPAVASTVPPLVKNLRRPTQTRTVKAVVRGQECRAVDCRGLKLDRRQRSLVAGTADLNRLCRLLL